MEPEFVDGVIFEALTFLRSAANQNGPEIITFALYFDHEGSALSVCADTIENSQRTVDQTNSFNFKYFSKAIEHSDLEKASLWQCNIGRSLSVGDFKHVNLARRDMPSHMSATKLFLEMPKGIMRHTHSILAVCDPRNQIVFATSTENDEVGLVWSPPTNT